MFFIREIRYLYVYQNNRKEASAGTCKFRTQGDRLLLDFYLKKMDAGEKGEAKVCLTFRKAGEIFEETVLLDENKQEYHIGFSCKAVLEERTKLYCFVELSNGKVLCDEDTWSEFLGGSKQKVENAETVEEQIGEKTETVREMPEISEEIDPVVQQKEIVHIPDVRGIKQPYYVLKPENLKCFGDDFAHFMDNSFLLHGFYNYHHILLGPVKEADAQRMRIGVPGNYYYREEMVAAMFDFISFVPVKGETKTGAFGYYFTDEMF